MSYYEKAEEIKEQNIHNFTIDNFELMDSLYDMVKDGRTVEEKRTALRVLNMIAQKQMDSYAGKFPTTMDYLSMNCMSCNVTATKSKDLLSTYRNLYSRLRCADRHIKMGHALGFCDADIAIYDAIAGRFFSSYTPERIQVTRLVSEYIKEHPYDINSAEDAQIKYNDELWTYIMSLFEQYHTSSIDEEMAPAYLFGEVLYSGIIPTAGTNDSKKYEDLPQDVKDDIDKHNRQKHEKSGSPVTELFVPGTDEKKIARMLKNLAMISYIPLSDRMKVYNTNMGKARFWALVYVALTVKGIFIHCRNIVHYHKFLEKHLDAKVVVKREKISEYIPKEEEFETFSKINNVRAIAEVSDENTMRKKLRQYLLIKTMIDAEMK